MAIATGTALTVLAGASLVGAAATTYGAVEGERAQRHGRYRQREAQAEALRQQMIERQRSVQAEMRANQPTPTSAAQDIDAPFDTDRTGGVTDRHKLARRSMLGGY